MVKYELDCILESVDYTKWSVLIIVNYVYTSRLQKADWLAIHDTCRVHSVYFSILKVGYVYTELITYRQVV